MIKIVTHPKEGYKFVPVSQREEKKPFTVWVKPIAAEEMMALEDSVVVQKADKTMYIASASFAFKIAQRAIVSWSGVEDEKGKEIPLTKTIDNIVDSDKLGIVPADMIQEISNAVLAVTSNPSDAQVIFEGE